MEEENKTTAVGLEDLTKAELIKAVEALRKGNDNYEVVIEQTNKQYQKLNEQYNNDMNEVNKFISRVHERNEKKTNLMKKQLEAIMDMIDLDAYQLVEGGETNEN